MSSTNEDMFPSSDFIHTVYETKSWRLGDYVQWLFWTMQHTLVHSYENYIWTKELLTLNLLQLSSWYFNFRSVELVLFPALFNPSASPCWGKQCHRRGLNKQRCLASSKNITRQSIYQGPSNPFFLNSSLEPSLSSAALKQTEKDTSAKDAAASWENSLWISLATGFYLQKNQEKKEVQSVPVRCFCFSWKCGAQRKT